MKSLENTSLFGKINTMSKPFKSILILQDHQVHSIKKLDLNADF